MKQLREVWEHHEQQGILEIIGIRILKVLMSIKIYLKKLGPE